MSTPLFSAVQGYIQKNAARFHMPGHKGTPLPPFGECTQFDITEVAGCDSLYEAQDAIAGTEASFSRIYGTVGSFLSAGGSTLCIQAMLSLAAKPGDTIICARGTHTAALSAMALLDLHPVWIFPESDSLTGLSCPVTPSQLLTALEAHPDAAAVYITSPTYYGLLSDIAAMSVLCKSRNIPLLVDNAHGAHLKFLPGGSRHPIDFGADLCCDSLHKTLPALTGAALLHIGNPRYLGDAKRRMSLFGSTSPSYLIMLSADVLLPYLEGAVYLDIENTIVQIKQLERIAAETGFVLQEGARDPIRLTLGFLPLGFDSESFRVHLGRYTIEPEYCMGGYCIFLAGAQNNASDYSRLAAAITTAPEFSGGRQPTACEESPFAPPEQMVSIREAMLAFEQEIIPVADSLGRVSGSSVAPCPPGIPIVVAGEQINGFTQRMLKKSGILSVNVLK